MQTCDLHTHSIYSDGTCPPGQIIAAAVGLGLSAVALCDHNTVDGLPDFLAAAAGAPIEAIAGAEFSVDHEGTELHLLGLFLKPEHFAPLSRQMAEVNERKQQSNIDLVRALNRAGYAVDYDAIRNSTPNGTCNRAHIARELTRLGYTASLTQAFDTLLSPAAGYYQAPQRLTFWQMLDALTDLGAVPVLAHPLLNLDEAALTALLPRAKERGLIGMECAYARYDGAATQVSLALADRFGLCPSGGSDFHGTNKPDIALGTGRGNLQVPYTWALRLKNTIL